MSNEQPHNSPFEVKLVAGETYYWCSCGRSANQPYCDGSHKGSEHQPVAFTAEQSKTAWLCGCKQTATRPFCDGTHNQG